MGPLPLAGVLWFTGSGEGGRGDCVEEFDGFDGGSVGGAEFVGLAFDADEGSGGLFSGHDGGGGFDGEGGFDPILCVDPGGRVHGGHDSIRINGYWCHEKVANGEVRRLVEAYAEKLGPDGSPFASEKGAIRWPCYSLDKYEIGMIDAVRLAVDRMPQWLECAAAIRRKWGKGDRVEVQFPARFRMEAVDDKHQKMARPLRGVIQRAGQTMNTYFQTV